MNIFLSNKLSSYLSDNTDLSLYKNYVTLNAAVGELSVSHNFHQPVDSDDWVRSFVVVGARANVANAYAARFSNKYFDNQLGITIQKTWMGKPVTFYDKCGSQKQAMDAQRAVILRQLYAEMARKATDFEHGAAMLKQEDIPGQSITVATEKLRQDFYALLREEFLQKFSQAQSDVLIRTNSYSLVTDSWTTLGAYIPIIPQKFAVSPTINDDATKKYNYPLELSLVHTRFWESSKAGRFFLSIVGKAFLNNSVQSAALYNADVNGLEAHGVTVNKGNRFIGNYKNFVTPVAALKLVYIPPDSHVGLSYRIEKNFGNYGAVNSVLGIPVVLIDKNGVPAINFEFQLLFSDMTNSIKGSQLPWNKNAIGLTVGVPFSKIVY